MFEKQDDKYITYDRYNKKILIKDEFIKKDKLTNVYKINDNKKN